MIYWMLTGDFVVGGSERSESLEVPEVDGVVQTAAGHLLSVSRVRQTLDVVLLLSEGGGAGSSPCVPQLESDV